MPRIEQRLKKILAAAKPIKTMRAMMGRPDGTLEVSGEPQMIWATGRGMGGAFKVLNRRVPLTWGKEVNLGYDPNDLPTRLQVLGIADLYQDANWDGPAVPNHAETHNYGERDCDWILTQRILRVIPVPLETKVDIYPQKIMTSSGWWVPDVMTRVDYTAQIPANGVRICIIVLDASRVIAFRNGTTQDTRALLTAADYPTLTAGDYGICGIYLKAGMSEAFHTSGNDDFIDLSYSGAIGSSTSAITSLTTDVVATGPGAAVATIQPGAVTNAKLASAPAYTVKGNATGAPATEQDLTVAQLLAMGAGVFGGAQEVVNEAPNGILTDFTFTNPAYAIWVVADGVVQKSEDVTFVAGTVAFSLSWAPATGTDLRVIRLAPVVNPSPHAFPDYTAGVSKTKNNIYQEATDGWLCVLLVGSYKNGAGLFVGPTSPPTTLIAQSGDDYNNNTKATCWFIPISAGTYYKLTSPYWSDSEFESITMTFYPVV